MKTLMKKISTSMLALSLMVGAVTYPTKDANAGVGLAVVGAVASNGSGMIILPEAVAIAAMVGGLGIFMYGCYGFLDQMEPGNIKGAALAFGILFLDKGVQNNNLQADLRQRLVTNYKAHDLNENDADLLAQIIANKVSNTQVNENSNTEILFTSDELAQVVNSISESNPALAQKITEDFTKPTFNKN